MDELFQAVSELFGGNVVRITVSDARGADCPFKKVIIRPATIRGQQMYQFEKLTQTQAFHENIPAGQAPAEVAGLLKSGFKQVDAITDKKQISLRLTKKGRLLRHKGAAPQMAEAPQTHDRRKHYLLEEGLVVPALVDLGVITAQGKVVASKYDKFRQINRFIELINDAVQDDDRPVWNILDFGCGKSYLTFILYYYLTVLAGKKVNMIGLDLKEQVIEDCNAISQRYGYGDGLKFECGAIEGYQPSVKPDMVISLHACDTATDAALYNSIKWQADYIFSAPCCQHQMNQTIRMPAPSLITDYGIIRERFCALATDAIRAKLLEACGYRTQIIEFIELEHSPKNLLLRARRTGRPGRDALNEVEAFFREYPGENELYRLLRADGVI